MPAVDFPFDEILFNKDVSSSSDFKPIDEGFCGDLCTNLFIKWLIARGNCNQKSASEVSPNIAAAKANLAAQPLLTIVEYSLALSSSSMQPSIYETKRIHRTNQIVQSKMPMIRNATKKYGNLPSLR